MSHSPKHGRVVVSSSKNLRSRRRSALARAIESLESRTLLTTVTYIVQTNSDTVAPIVIPSGTNQFSANTLRAAINSANSQSFPAVIEFNAAKFPGGAANTITLGGGLTLGPVSPAGKHTYTLIGPTTNPITISGSNLYTDFTVNAGVTSKFQSLTIAHGTGATGGGIDSAGPLTLVSDTFASNAGPGGDGGAVYNGTGQVTVTNSTFIANSAEAGGALYIFDLTSGAHASISGSTFSANTATDDGGTIENYSNVNATLTVSSSTFTGNTVGSSDQGGGAVFNFSALGTLTASISSSTFSNDSTAENGGAVYSSGKSLTLSADTFTGDKSSAAYGGAVYSLDGTLNASGTTFSNDKAFEFGGGIYYQGSTNPTLTVSSCTFTNDATLDAANTDGYGGAICDDGGTNSKFTLTGSTFTSNNAADFSSGVYSQGGTGSILTATSDTFTGDTAATGDGGGLDSYDDTLTVTGSTFTNDSSTAGYGGGLNSYAIIFTAANDTFTTDSAYAGGGGIEFYGAGTGTGSNTADIAPFDSGGSSTGSVTNSTFNGDFTTVFDGAGIQSSANEFTVTSSTFTNDNAVEYGGGIHSTDLVLNVDSDSFMSDNGSFDGGGIYFAGPSGTANVSNSTFTDNSASNNDEGGAIFGTSATATLNVTSDTFTGNTAGYDGGAIAFLGSDFNVSQSSFTNNSADANGGGAIITNAATFDLFDSTFIGNSSAAGAGGGVNFYGTDANIANDTFYGNSAGGTTAGGGGLYLNAGETVTITDSTFDDNTAGFALGGGIQNDPAGGDVILDGNIVALNSVVVTPNTASDLSGTFDVASTDNLIGDGSGQTGFTAGNVGGNFVGTDLAPINPMLGAPANNGGPTLTQVPASGSVAISHNQNFTIFDTNGDDITATDQTGLNARPEATGYDIGAYQTGGSPVVVTPNVSIKAPATVHLPASGTTTIKIPVTLSSKAGSAIVLTYSTLGGTATSGHGDYSGVTNATFTIPAGSPAGTYYITIYNARHETSNGAYPKTFQVKLSAAGNANVIGGTETVTVTLAYP